MIVDPYEIEDTSDWLGSPTELETCKQYMLMLENEVQELTLQLRKAREDIFGLVQMNGQLSNEKSKLKSELGNTNAQIEHLRAKTSELDSQVRSLLLIKDQRDYLLRQMGIHNDVRTTEMLPSA
jgi:chromosome segregation ATPase